MTTRTHPIDGDRSSTDTVFCSGGWSATLLAETEADHVH
jgi:hypothetical protein